jgi:molybdopterin molybdotransferase
VEPASPLIVLSYADAARVVREHAAALSAHPRSDESVTLLDSLGRILAAPVIADRDQPPFPRSTRDGFACRSADLSSDKSLLVTGQLRAGETWTGAALAPGQAIEIMTGAPVPVGADCVLMVEHATVQTTADGPRIRTDRPLQPGENIVPAGAEARAGTTLVPPGTRIGPQHIAASAACGYASLSVYARPRVAVLATGDELVPIAAQPLPHQIRNSNSYSIAAQVIERGGKPVLYPILRDNIDAIESAIEEALACDLLILSGGVSMGKYDFVEQALLNLHAEFIFTGVRMQPGRPVVFGRLPVVSSSNQNHRYFFGLPGNPVSTIVTFALFAAPLLAALAGEASDHIGPRFVESRLASKVTAKPGLARFLPAYLEGDAGHTLAHPIPWQGSGDQAATARTNCFLAVPEETGDLSPGDSVSILIPW